MCTQVVRARLAVLDGRLGKAAGYLQQAVDIEAGSGYTEPPRFFQPMVRVFGCVWMRGAGGGPMHIDM